MYDKLKIAIENNNKRYEAIFRQLGVDYKVTEDVWYSLDKVPPFYSNIVTRTETWRPDTIFDLVRTEAIKRQWAGWTMKDSFSVLDMSENGFHRLFDAHWVYLEASEFNPGRPVEPLQYKIVANNGELASWRQTWDSHDQHADEIFSDGLLNDPEISIVAGYLGSHLVCGCMLNRSDHVVGVSNFFSPANELIYWADSLNFILNYFEFLPIVGYERVNLAHKLQSLGFQLLGNLTVWATTSNS